MQLFAMQPQPAVKKRGAHSDDGDRRAEAGHGGGSGAEAGAGAGGGHSAPPVAKRTRVDAAACSDPAGLLHDPAAFECPCASCEYDCQKRAPVRTPCACHRLMCRKCAGVAASLPGPAPCGACGAAAVGPFEPQEFRRDSGVLLALLGRLKAHEPYVAFWYM